MNEEDYAEEYESVLGFYSPTGCPGGRQIEIPVDAMFVWDKVSKTNPKHTKQINVRGGFTAVDAQYQIETATRIFGPYGMGWGVDNVTHDFVRVQEPTLDGSSETIKEVVVTGKLWYILEGSYGHFPVQTSIKWKPGDDWFKKAVTDMTTKGLSKLGFNADVFLGRFDDNKYVQEMYEFFGEEKPNTDWAK